MLVCSITDSHTDLAESGICDHGDQIYDTLDFLVAEYRGHAASAFTDIAAAAQTHDGKLNDEHISRVRAAVGVRETDQFEWFVFAATRRNDQIFVVAIRKEGDVRPEPVAQFFEDGTVTFDKTSCVENARTPRVNIKSRNRAGFWLTFIDRAKVFSEHVYLYRYSPGRTRVERITHPGHVVVCSAPAGSDDDNCIMTDIQGGWKRVTMTEWDKLVTDAPESDNDSPQSQGDMDYYDETETYPYIDSDGDGSEYGDGSPNPGRAESIDDEDPFGVRGSAYHWGDAVQRMNGVDDSGTPARNRVPGLISAVWEGDEAPDPEWAVTDQRPEHERDEPVAGDTDSPVTVISADAGGKMSSDVDAVRSFYRDRKLRPGPKKLRGGRRRSTGGKSRAVTTSRRDTARYQNAAPVASVGAFAVTAMLAVLAASSG